MDKRSDNPTLELICNLNLVFGVSILPTGVSSKMVYGL